MAMCPSCESTMVRRSRRRGVFERLRSQIFNQYPHRCMLCYARYWAKLDDVSEPREAVVQETPAPAPPAPRGRAAAAPHPLTTPRGR